MKKQMAVSPLATHEARASSTSSPSPLSSPDIQPMQVKSKFFERGLGTQVMLANMTSQAKQLLFDKARRVLSEEDADILKEDLVQVSLKVVAKPPRTALNFILAYSMKTLEVLTSL